MTMIDRLPGMSDADLASLQANAQRLETQGSTPGQQKAAAEMLPLIAAELADREARKPPKPAPKPRKTAAKKAAAPTEA
jgi:hypothetical protein